MSNRHDDLDHQLRAMYQDVADHTPGLARAAIPTAPAPNVTGSGRTRTSVPLIAATAVLVVAAGAAALISALHSRDDARTPTVTDNDSPPAADIGLIVALDAGLQLQARITGVLGVDARGCVTVNDLRLIAPDGSTVTDDGKGVEFPGAGVIAFGSYVEGPGGQVRQRRQVSYADPAGCLSSNPTTDYLEVTPRLLVSLTEPDAGQGISQLQPADGKARTRVLQNYVKLADCPAALDFYSDPTVRDYYAENFGYSLDPQHTYYPECPTTAALQHSYRESLDHDAALPEDQQNSDPD